MVKKGIDLFQGKETNEEDADAAVKQLQQLHKNQELAQVLKQLQLFVSGPSMKKMFQADGTPDMAFINDKFTKPLLEKYETDLGNFEDKVKTCKENGCNAEKADEVLKHIPVLKESCKAVADIKEGTVKMPNEKEKMDKSVEWIENQALMYPQLLSKRSPLNKQLPGQTLPASPDDDLVTYAAKSAAAQVEIAQTQLDKEQQRYDATFAQSQKIQHQIREEMSKLAKFNAQLATTEEIVKILAEAVKSLAMLKSQWENLSLFFEGLGRIIKNSMNPPLRDLVENMKKGKDRMTPLLRQTIYGHAYDCSKMSFLVNALSSAYYELSREFFMPMVSELAILLAETDKGKVQKKKSEILLKAQEVEMDLRRTLKSEQADFKLKCDARRNELKKAFVEIPLPEEQKVKIQIEVSKTANELDVDYEALM